MKPSDYKITFIGAGNVAHHLSKAFYRKGFTINQVYSRSITNAIELSSSIDAKAIDKLNEIDYSSDVFIFAISDSALVEVLNQLSFKDQIIIHTAGSLDIDIFSQHSSSYGVFYPLQTFSKRRDISFSEIPLCIEANNELTRSVLKFIAESLSEKIYEITSEERKILHLAAIFANNYTNYMYCIAQKIIEKSGLDFNLIRPLILETAGKVQEILPDEAQTGPAYRNDSEILQKHMQLLKENEEFRQLYSLLAKSIQKKR